MKMKRNQNERGIKKNVTASCASGNLIVPSRMEWLRRAEALRQHYEYGAVDLAESVSQ